MGAENEAFGDTESLYYHINCGEHDIGTAWHVNIVIVQVLLSCEMRTILLEQDNRKS